jgi:hypothetical protein
VAENPRAHRRPRAIRELYYITHVENLPSILNNGIFSHKLILEKGIKYTPIYNEEIVSRRKAITVPDGRSLWDFANLYFQARNPMMYKVVCDKPPNNIAVIGVGKSILERPDVLLTTGNAAHSQTEFPPVSQKAKVLPLIAKEIDRVYWNDADGSKRKIMAECLVPDIIPPEYIKTVYFADYRTMYKVRGALGKPLHASFMYEPYTFFQPARVYKITPNLFVREGDMFFSRAQTLTVSVNTVGIMGKGVASRAKYQFPDVYVHYQDLCRARQLKMGKPALYKREKSFDFELADEPESLENANNETWFLLFPTKKHWREDADIKGIEQGLQWILENYQKEGIKTLALPALGCGLGNLEWKEVGPLLCSYLSALKIPAYIYLPAEKEVSNDLLSPEFLLKERTRF